MTEGRVTNLLLPSTHRNFPLQGRQLRSSSAKPGYGNDDLPWLYTQPLQNIGGANGCIVLGK